MVGTNQAERQASGWGVGVQYHRVQALYIKKIHTVGKLMEAF